MRIYCQTLAVCHFAVRRPDLFQMYRYMAVRKHIGNYRIFRKCLLKLKFGVKLIYKKVIVGIYSGHGNRRDLCLKKMN